MAGQAGEGIKDKQPFHEYGQASQSLKALIFDIDEPGIIKIIGPSGTGKSTLQLYQPASTIQAKAKSFFDGADLTNQKHKRYVNSVDYSGMVFQEYNPSNV
ncbi:hypothetical protein O9929_12130 [Vibrio lentus]|nr:hypothetical protein [Vibrio lentus]